MTGGGKGPTRDECIKNAGAAFAKALVERDALSPRAAAEAAHVRGGPSVDELEHRIRLDRGLTVAQDGAA